MFFPFWAHSERYGVSETTLITPFFQHTTDLRGWATNIHPLLYVGRERDQHAHGVRAHSLGFRRAEVARDRRLSRLLALRDGDRGLAARRQRLLPRGQALTGGSDWEIHVFPAFTYGETPDGHWWNILYGLAGYTRRGNLVKVRAAWIPISLSGETIDRRAPRPGVVQSAPAAAVICGMSSRA